MQIVLDTTSIYEDYFLVRPATVEFLRGLHKIPAQLLVPEVVVDEMVRHYRRDLETALRSLADAAQQITRLRAATVPPGPSLNIDQRANKYREALLARIAEFGGEVLPYPKITHKDLAARDLSGRKPFDQNGRGYRDALIWESVRSKTWGGHERVVFVSNNSKDFGKAPQLHEGLRREILNPDRLSLASSLQEFNAQWIVPKMEMLENLRRALEAHASGEIDLFAWLRAELLNSLRREDETITSLVSWSPTNRMNARPSELVELKDLRVHSVRALDGDEVLVRVEVRADIEVHVSWNDHGGIGGSGYASTWILQEFSVGMDLVLDRVRREVVSEEVAMIGTPDATVDFGSWKEPSASPASTAPTTPQNS